MNHHHAMTRSAHAVLILLTLAAIVPFVLLIIASFTDNNVAITEGFSFFPSKWSTDAYQYIVNEKDTMLRAYGITIVVTLIGTTLGLLISVMLAYSLANSDLPGRNFMTFFVTLTMLFNGGLVPTYLIYTNVFHIKDTLAALIVPNLLMNGFNVILIRNYFATGVPTVLYEAARIDGASEFYIFYRIALPLSKPILATVGLLMGIAYWNDWQMDCTTSTTPPSTAFRTFSTALTKTFPSLRATAPPASRFQTFPPAPFAWPLRSLAFCPSSASTPSSRNTSSEALPLAL